MKGRKIRVSLINTRVSFTNQAWTRESYIDRPTSKEAWETSEKSQETLSLHDQQ